jgi:hypothetical protein
LISILTLKRRGFLDAIISYWSVLLVALALVATPTRTAAAAAFDYNDESWQGASELLAVARSVANPNRVKLVAELNYDDLTAQDAVLVLHPEVLLDFESLRSLFEQGGRLAILDDFGKSNLFFDRFGIERIQAPMDPSATLRGNWHLPVGTPADVVGNDGSVQPNAHPLLRGVEAIYLNHPSGLTANGLTKILEIRRKNGPAVTMAVSAISANAQQGRLLVMSDPSALINLMIRYPGNLAFAQNIIRYLTEDDAHRAEGRLFIVSNRFGQTGHFSAARGFWENSAETIDRVASELRQGLPPALLISLTAMVALAIAGWVAKHIWRPSPLALPRALRPLAAIDQAGWPGRVAVLAAPTTHPALLLVELREAFRERLVQLLALDRNTSSSAIVSAVESRSLLPAPLQAALRDLLAEVDAAERAVITRKPMRVSKQKLTRLLHQCLEILDCLTSLERPNRESSLTSQ